MIEHALAAGSKRPMTLYWGALAERDLYMPGLPEKWASEHDSFYFIPVLSNPMPQDGWTGRTGLVHQAVLEDKVDLRSVQVYCCGAPAMVEAAHRDFTAEGLPEDEFFSDAFTFAAKMAAT